MPCVESLLNMAGSYISPLRLSEKVRNGELIMLDCRNQTEFARSHITGAINITLPCLMMRRLKKGNLKIQCIIQNQEAKEKFNRLSKSNENDNEVILYDDCPCDVNSNPSTTVDLLQKKLQQDGAKTCVLQGGFMAFENNYHELCAGIDNTEDIMGMCNLKISDDSGIGSTDSDCDNVNSPSSQSTSFPVEVLPYLYLGNAKNSADINQLKKYGITYILNVTPNVPNKFEDDKDFTYMQIAVADQLSQNLSSFFPEAIAFIDEGRRNNHGVLVHCLAGISRSVTFTVAYLMQMKAMSLNKAYDHVKGCKPNISPNFNFMGQLLDFEKVLGVAPSKEKPNEFHCPTPSPTTYSVPTFSCEVRQT